MLERLAGNLTRFNGQHRYFRLDGEPHGEFAHQP